MAAAHVEADAIIHFGAACLSPNSGPPVLHIFQPEDISIPALVEAIRQINDTNLSTLVVYESQYQRQYENLKRKSTSNVTGSQLIGKGMHEATANIVCCLLPSSLLLPILKP